jgi:hypothetical protein
MTTTTSSAAIVPAMPVFTNTERLALAGFLAGYSGLTREATSISCAYSVPAARISNASPVTWKPAAEPAPPSPAGCAPSPGYTATQSRKNCPVTPRPPMSAGPGWTTSRMPPGWTATSSARCWSPSGSARRPSTR